ncbi:thiamine pyrophosphate-requiring protein [Mycobacterium sp. 4D054]|uniref:thiamine pyrophosphate-requiring protein n=1 Tax=Mycobacterium sp. 4D054 TaxID=3457440 RepID=UPI003FD408E9
MPTDVSDFILDRLRQWNITHVFGYPGDGINGLISALSRAHDDPRFVQARHEEMAAMAAVGYAKFSGQVGVCLATSGPGAVHLLNGLYDAKLDHVPVVAIIGQTARSAMGSSYQQEVDLQALFADVASDYVVEVNVSEQLPMALDRAIRTARTRRAPTVVIVPSDLQDTEYEPPEHRGKHVPSSDPVDEFGVITPAEGQVRRAAEILNDGERVAILIGQGARGARREVVRVAELTGAGVAKALLGKDVLPDDLPFVTGPIGMLGSRPSHKMMRACDTLLIVGSNFPYTQYLPEFGQARAVQIDDDGTSIGMRYPTELNIVADARVTLAGLQQHLRPKPHTHWREGIETDVRRWWTDLEQECMRPAQPVNPMRIAWELSDRLPDNAIVTADSGSSTAWYAQCVKFTAGVRGSVSGTLASMGCAVPYAIGAKFAHPDRPAIALVGDGAIQMNGLNELLTIARYRDEWDDQRLVVCVFGNGDLNQVTWELRESGTPRFEPSQTLPAVSYAAVAQTMGVDARTVESEDDLGRAWDWALSAPGPTLLDVRCDPEIPSV